MASAPPPAYTPSPSGRAPNLYPGLAPQSLHHSPSQHSHASTLQHNSSYVNNQPPLSKVELSVKCEDLKNMDFFSKSDPIVVMYLKRGGHNAKYQEIGRTEIIWDNLNPEFTKKFVVDYYFEEVQPIKFEVYDIDNEATRDLSSQDFLGQIEMTLAEAAQGEIKRPLLGKSNSGGSHGNIIISAEELNAESANTIFHIKANASNVKKQKGFIFSSNSNVYLSVSKCASFDPDSNNYISVHKTSPISSSSPSYPNFDISSQLLCNGDMHRPIRFSLIHNAANGTLTTLHTFQTTPEELASGFLNLSCKDNSKTKLTLNSRAETRPSFISYLNSGMELNFHVAVDFTASNGDPATPSSLHFLNPQQMNCYEFAIHSIGEVLEQYDTDKLFPAYGFGARLPPNGMVSHDFSLNGSIDNPEVQGVQGIMQAYKNTLSSIRLYGPTNFSPIIRRVTQHVRSMASEQSSSNKSYSVLMILK